MGTENGNLVVVAGHQGSLTPQPRTAIAGSLVTEFAPKAYVNKKGPIAEMHSDPFPDVLSGRYGRCSADG